MQKYTRLGLVTDEGEGYADSTQVSVCNGCGAVVAIGWEKEHDNWHDELELTTDDDMDDALTQALMDAHSEGMGE